MERDFSITPLLVNHQAHPGKNNWVKIFIYEPAEVEVLKSRGTMYAVLSLSAKSTVDFTAIMQSILEELHTQYFQQTTGTILQTLEKSLDGIHKKLILMGQEDKRLAEDFNFNLLTAVSWGTVLYFGQLGSSRAALLRNDKLFDIDEGEQKTTNQYLSSGVLQTNDKVILGTNQFFKRFNRTNLKKALSLPQDKIVAALEEGLDPGLDRQSQSAIVLSVDIKQVPSPQEEGFKIIDPDNSNSSSASTKNIGGGRRSRLGSPGSIVAGIKKLFSLKIAGFIPLIPVALVLVAVAALYFSLNSDQEWQPQFGPNQALIASASKSINQAGEVAEINPDRALDLLSQAEGSIQEGLSDYPQNADLLSLQSKHNQLKKQILIVTELKPQQVVNIDIQPSQVKLVYYDSSNYLIDAQKQELISISLNGHTNVVDSNFHYAQGAFLAASEAGLIIVSRGEAIPFNANGESGELSQLPEAAQPVAMTGFAQNGYILDSSGQLYRVPHMGDSVGSITNYFQRPVGGSTLVDVAIDGTIYLLREDGTMDAYLNGEKQQLVLERASLANQGRAIFTSPDSSNLYILKDAEMVVWDKDGKYVGQYQFESQDKWQMATIDTENNTLFVVVNNSLVRATLPN